MCYYVSYFCKVNSNLINKTTGFKGLLTATEINDASIIVSYTGDINPATADELGLASGWWTIAHMAHVSPDGYCAQVVYPYTAADIPRYRNCYAGTWSKWTYLDGGSRMHIHPGAAIISGTWLTGLYMASWGLIVQIPSCYLLNMSVKNSSILVSGIGWKTLPAPSISLSYQTYILAYNVSGMGLTDGMAYVVTFDASTV